MTEPLDGEICIQQLTSHIPGMIYQYVLRTDGSESFTYVSPRCRDIYELEPEDLLRDFGLVWATIHPEDRERVRQVNLNSAQQLERFDIEFRLLPPSVCLRWIRAISQPNKQANGDTIWDGFVLDISDRKQTEFALQQSEAKFRLFAENSQDVIWIAQLTSPDNLYVSPAYEKIWGQSRQNLVERPDSWLEAIHPHDRDRVRIKLEQQSQGNSTNVEYRIVRPDGELRWIWDRSFPIQNELGQIYSFGGIAEDITERKQSEVELRAKQQLIEHINEEFCGLD
jgi:PAS domain S-box-containing protein